MEKIKVVLVRPGKVSSIEEIDSSLRGMQRIVGGTIQAIYPFEDNVALVCNDDGKLLGLEPNRALIYDRRAYDIIAGTFFICGIAGESFASLTPAQLTKYQTMFAEPHRFIKSRRHHE